jgi:hypothetical protein
MLVQTRVLPALTMAVLCLTSVAGQAQIGVKASGANVALGALPPMPHF